MRKLLASLAVLVTVGCDDPTVHELITSNFVCTYMPWWMGECDSEEMADRAQNVLSYGLVNAQIRCEGEFAHHFVRAGDNSGNVATMKPFMYEARKLQDGSCFTNFSVTPSTEPVWAPSRLWSRVDVEANSCKQDISDHFRVNTESGSLVIESDEESHIYCEPFPYCGPGPTPDTELDIESVCTGFNLEAFGVEE